MGPWGSEELVCGPWIGPGRHLTLPAGRRLVVLSCMCLVKQFEVGVRTAVCSWGLRPVGVVLMRVVSAYCFGVVRVVVSCGEGVLVGSEGIV